MRQYNQLVDTRLGQLISRRAGELRITYSELARIVGYKDGGIITHIVHGRRAIPSHMVEAFASALKVDPIELLDLLPDDERYRVIREKILQQKRFTGARPATMSNKRIPIFVVSAGWRSFNAEGAVGYMPLPDALVEQLGDRGVAFFIEGDSMEPVLNDGDLVIADKVKSYRNGSICICCICYGEGHPDNLATVKAVYKTKEGKIRLVPANHSYDSEIVKDVDLQSLEIWPVIFHMRNYRNGGMMLEM